MTSYSDNLLLAQIQQGDEQSFELVFHQHYDRVYGILYRLVGNRAEAEDLVQEVFIKLHDYAYRKRYFALNQAQTPEHNLGAWLYRTATNMGLNAIRSRKRRWQRDVLLAPDPNGAPGPALLLEQAEQAVAVRAALAQLSKRQAQLLILRQMEFSYAECAAICHVAPGSVGTLLARAAAAFKQAYELEINRNGVRQGP